MHFREIKAHVPEPFWRIVLKYGEAGQRLTEFQWARGRLFDHQMALLLYEMCLFAGSATVTNVIGEQKTRRAPVPLSTLEMQKKGTGTLRASGDNIMSAAEALYQKGLISYPRTETDQFDPAQDVLVRLVCPSRRRFFGLVRLVYAKVPLIFWARTL